MERDYEKQILEICKGYVSSELYSMIREAAEDLVTNASDRQKTIADLMDSAKNYYKDDPMHMLGYLNLLRKMGGNPFALKLQSLNQHMETSSNTETE